MDYGQPTWKQYDDQEEQWLEWKRQAARLPLEEVLRHSLVSSSNRHSCHNCFCCAAREVYNERVSLLGGKRV